MELNKKKLHIYMAMERDFLGLSVKQDPTSDAPPPPPPPPRNFFLSCSIEKFNNAWSFPNKASSIPQLLSFQEEKGKAKAGFGSLAMTTDAFDSDHKAYVAPQKSFVSERNGATAYSAKHHDSHMIHHMVVNPMNLSIAAPGSVHRPFDLSLGSQPLATVPFANPVTALSSGSPVIGSTDLRNGPKISGGPTQLTIFYNGSVSVYDNITPDGAQAIMLLAGNGPPTPAPRPPVLDSFVVSATPHRSSSIAVAPLSIVQPNVLSCTNSETVAAKTGVFIMSSAVIAEPLRLNKSLASAAASMKFHSSDTTVPQFRKKSLARFLEKRRERVINAALPYDKESADCSNASTTGGSGSRPVPAMK